MPGVPIETPAQSWWPPRQAVTETPRTVNPGGFFLPYTIAGGKDADATRSAA